MRAPWCVSSHRCSEGSGLAAFPNSPGSLWPEVHSQSSSFGSLEMGGVTPYLVRPGRVQALMELAAQWPAVVLDVETTGLRPYLGDKNLGFSITSLYPQGEEVSAYYVPLSHPDADNVSVEEASQLGPILNGKALLGHQIKFDLHCTVPLFGEMPDSPLYDTLVMGRIMSYEDRPELSLEALAGRELGYTYRSKAAGKQSQYGKGVFTVQDIGTKCCEDVFCTAGLYRHYKERMPDALKSLFVKECHLTRILFQMERRGVLYDAKEAKALDAQLAEKSKVLKAGLQKATGSEDFNPRSSPQVVG